MKEALRRVDSEYVSRMIMVDGGIRALAEGLKQLLHRLLWQVYHRFIIPRKSCNADEFAG